MRRIVSPLAVALGLFAFGCSSTPPPSVAVAEPTATAAIAAAKAAQQQADSIKGGWVTTDKLIAKAEAALAKGEEAEALKVARKAEHEAKLAYEQARQQQEEWAEPPYITSLRTKR